MDNGMIDCFRTLLRKPIAMPQLRIYNKQDILSQTRIRRFETKLGERIQVLANPNNLLASLQQSSAKFVLLGVPEDIGVKANYGIGGADSAWLPFPCQQRSYTSAILIFQLLNNSSNRMHMAMKKK